MTRGARLPIALRPIRYALALCLIAVSAAALAGPPAASAPVSLQQLNGLARLVAPTYRGPRVFVAEAPGAESSRAWLNLADVDDSAAEVEAGYVLNNRVTVQTGDPAALRRWVAERPGLRVRVLPAAGFYSVRTGSVAKAIEAAEALSRLGWVRAAHVDLTQPVSLRDVPDDPYLQYQWHLINYASPGTDARVLPVWQSGLSGAGVTIGIVELSSWQLDHPDLAAHWNVDASQPGGAVASHTTSVAGVAAAAGGNGIFGSGAAFAAQLATQRVGSDEQTAEALAFRNDLNDIKNNSWGPLDEPRYRALPPVVQAALAEGVANGRGGLGTIFVWAGGNGGGTGDRVDYDPYASSRYTIAVNAIGDQDTRTSYDERGSAVMVCAHSHGNVRWIQTTDWNSGWTNSFGGTSSAAPLASGVIALMLEANPALTWRDVQHVLVNSARKVDPANTEWEVNGAGHDINYYYGFGAVDASAAAPLAQTWRNVPHEVVVDTGAVPVGVVLPDNDQAGFDATVLVGRGIRIEHVELFLNVQTTFIGDLRIVITSPSGTSSVVASQRFDQQDDLINDLFTSVRHWDESSAGTWTVHVSDRRAGTIATWNDFRLVFHGTPLCPGDLDENGLVELSDLMVLLPVYGACEGDAAFVPEADLDNSGCIDLADLSEFLEVFGQACE